MSKRSTICRRSSDEWRAEGCFQHQLFRRAVKDGRHMDADVAAREVERCFDFANRAMFLDDGRVA